MALVGMEPGIFVSKDSQKVHCATLTCIEISKKSEVIQISGLTPRQKLFCVFFSCFVSKPSSELYIRTKNDLALYMPQNSVYFVG